MSKLWAGRTSGEVSSIADDFNSSIRFDCKLYKQDITGSMAHAAMLGAQGIISQAEAGQLIDGLQGILNDLESGALEFDFGCEDIHMFVEQVLTQRLGDVGKKLHTARSRNDQVALDLRMYLKDQIDEITALVKDVLSAIVAQVEANKGVIMPGYTHLQRAQPILFSHHLMAYAMMLLRDLGRLGDCRKRMNVCPIGSCALAGTTYPTDRRFEARKLGFDDIARNSIDGVSDRGFCGGLMTAGCLVGMILLKLIDSKRLLQVSGVLTIVLLLAALFGSKDVSLIAFPAIGFSISMMYSIVFSLALNSASQHHGSFAGILCSAIVGGAGGPMIVSTLADATSLRTGMLSILLFVGYITFIGFWAHPLINNKTISLKELLKK